MAQSKLRFVHAADLHLDSPFIGLKSAAPAHVADDLCNATFAAYDQIVGLCLAEQVDALLIVGDVYDAADRNLRAQLRFADGIHRLANAGIRSFVCHGNHDPLDGWEARLDLPAPCTLFGPALGTAPIFPDDSQRAMVQGISYRTRETRDNLARHFKNLPKNRFDVALLHANVGGDPHHDAYAPCSLAELQSTSIDYWALGHVHARAELNKGDPAVVFPGNPQGRHANEMGARGVYLVTVDREEMPSLEFRAEGKVRWLRADIDIGSSSHMGEVPDTINAELASAQRQSGRPLVVRLTLTGRGPMNAELRLPGLADEQLGEVNETWKEEDSWIWCDRVRNGAQAPVDREAALEREDFVGDLSIWPRMIRWQDIYWRRLIALRSHIEALPLPSSLFAAITPAQLRALRRLRQDASLSPAERDRVEVILRSHQGETLRELAADLGYRYDTVRLWLQAWTAQGVDFVRHRPTGPPPDQTRRQQVATALADLLQAQDRPWTSAQLAQGLADVHDIQLNARPCRQYLQAMGPWARPGGAPRPACSIDRTRSRWRRPGPSCRRSKKVPRWDPPALFPGRRRLCLDLAHDHHLGLARSASATSTRRGSASTCWPPRLHRAPPPPRP